MTTDRRAVARDLVAAWERQQEVYITHRETRFEVMLDLVERLAPVPDVTAPGLRVLDLACGPGSSATRVQHRFGAAEVVGVDLDPLLLALADAASGTDDPTAGRRPTWVQADLRDPSWVQALPPGRFHAVVSTTASHWLTGGQLADLYTQVHGLLLPGGVLCNGDYLPATRPWGTIADAASDIGEARAARTVAAGADSWDAWWARARAEAAFAEQVQAHDEIVTGVRHEAPTLALHAAALRDAGFVEVELVWHDLTEGLLCAVA